MGLDLIFGVDGEYRKEPRPESLDSDWECGTCGWVWKSLCSALATRAVGDDGDEVEFKIPSTLATGISKAIKACFDTQGGRRVMRADYLDLDWAIGFGENCIIIPLDYAYDMKQTLMTYVGDEYIGEILWGLIVSGDVSHELMRLAEGLGALVGLGGDTVNVIVSF